MNIYVLGHLFPPFLKIWVVNINVTIYQTLHHLEQLLIVEGDQESHRLLAVVSRVSSHRVDHASLTGKIH